MDRAPWQVSRGHRDNAPESLQRRRRGEDGLLPRLPYLPRNEVRSHVGVDVVALVDVDPSDGHRRFARHPTAFTDRSQLPDLLTLEVVHLLRTGSSDKFWIKKLSREVVLEDRRVLDVHLHDLAVVAPELVELRLTLSASEACIKDADETVLAIAVLLELLPELAQLLAVML